jgi:hypothetical protein
MINWNCFISHEKNLLLFDLKDTKYANNFLFNLLFTKCFRNGENIYYLSKNILKLLLNYHIHLIILNQNYL